MPTPPAQPSAAQTHAAAERPRHITEHFQGAIERPRASAVYQFGLVVIALAMLVLPVLYIGLIAAVGWLVYLHATHDVFMLKPASHVGRAYIFQIAAYLAPMLAGGTLILFMIKPLFARRVVRSNPYTLEPGQEPLLYSFVDAVASAVGAPSPSVIVVNCEVNAGAGFRRGLLSLFTNDLQLVIGLPLLAGLDTRQLAGVLAHELGHFSQFVGMRLTYIVRSINGWFARIVYERDEWDEKLVDLSGDAGHWALSLTFLFARFCVLISRGILWVFMMAGHLLSCFLLRQMEYNADRYETRIAGVDAFESTTRRMAELNAAASHLMLDLRSAAAAKQLADDMPGFIVSTTTRIPTPVRVLLDRSLRDGRTGWLDTHPASKDRIRSAAEDGSPGIFRLSKPASCLLRNFDVLCKWTTIGLYHNMLGEHIKAEQLVPIKGLVKDDKIDDSARKSIERVFMGLLNPVRPIFPARHSTAEAPAFNAESQRLQRARRAMAEAAPAAMAVEPELRRADQRRVHLKIARSMLAADIAGASRALDLSRITPQALARIEPEIERLWSNVLSSRQPFEDAAAARLRSALRLLQTPDVAGKFQDAEKLRAHGREIDKALEVVSGSLGVRETLAAHLAMLAQVIDQASRKNAGEPVFAAITRTTRLVRDDLMTLRTILAEAPNPLDRSGQAVSLGMFVVPELPAENDIGELGPAAEAALERVMTVYFRLIGRVAIITEKVEHAMALPPLAGAHQGRKAGSGSSAA